MKKGVIALIVGCVITLLFLAYLVWATITGSGSVAAVVVGSAISVIYMAYLIWTEVTDDGN